MFQWIIDKVTGRPEPSNERLIKVERKVEDIDKRLTVLSARVAVKERNHAWK